MMKAGSDVHLFNADLSNHQSGTILECIASTNDPVSVVAICLFISTNLRFRDCTHSSCHTEAKHAAIEARNRGHQDDVDMVCVLQ